MKKVPMPLLLATLLAACAGSPTEPPTAGAAGGAATPPPTGTPSPVAAQLPRYHWRLNEANAAGGQRIDALFVRADKPLTLDFAEGRLGIGNACNRIGGRYRFEGDALVVDQLVSTQMACSDPKLMALDHEAGSRLEGRLHAALQPGDAPQLTLTTATNDVLAFIGAPTAATRYGSAGETVFLEVAAQTAPCPQPSAPDEQCLQVREVRFDDNGARLGPPGAYKPLQQDIEGYTHEPGIRTVLRVQRFRIAHPPADAPSEAYVLDQQVESELEDIGR